MSFPNRSKNLRIFGASLEERNVPKFIGSVVEIWWTEFLGLDFLTSV